MGGQIVAGESARELVGAQRFEEPGGGEVARLAIPLREGVVCHLANERLHEGVLAALRAAWVRFHREQLAFDQGPQARCQVGFRDA